MVRWMATWHLGVFSNFQMAYRHISANACQCTSRVSWTWQGSSIKWGALSEPESYKCPWPRAPPPQKAVLVCPLSGQAHHLECWLTKFFVDQLDIFYMYAEMGNDEPTEMQLNFQDSPNPSVFIITPKVGGTGLNLTAENHMVITQKFRLWNEQGQAFVRVVQLGQNSVPHTWLLNTGPNGVDNYVSYLHQLSEVAQRRVLHGLMSRPTITMLMIFQIVQRYVDKASYGARRHPAVRWWGRTIIVRAVKLRYASLSIQPTQTYHLMQHSQMVWRIRCWWGVWEYWLEFDSILC